MKLHVEAAPLQGEVDIPGSKSHTIRALYVASLADGRSEITDALDSGDTQGATRVCRGLGARIEFGEDKWVVDGFGGNLQSRDIQGSSDIEAIVVCTAAYGDRTGASIRI